MKDTGDMFVRDALPILYVTTDESRGAAERLQARRERKGTEISFRNKLSLGITSRALSVLNALS